MLGFWVWSLVGELGSHMPHRAAKKKKKDGIEGHLSFPYQSWQMADWNSLKLDNNYGISSITTQCIDTDWCNQILLFKNGLIQSNIHFCFIVWLCPLATSEKWDWRGGGEGLLWPSLKTVCYKWEYSSKWNQVVNRKRLGLFEHPTENGYKLKFRRVDCQRELRIGADFSHL